MWHKGLQQALESCREHLLIQEKDHICAGNRYDNCADGCGIAAECGLGTFHEVDGLHLPWQAATYDTDGFWDSCNPSRLTIAVGATEVRLTCSTAPQARSVSDGVFHSVEKTDAGDIPGAAAVTFRHGSTGYNSNDFAIVTSVLPVTACY